MIRQLALLPIYVALWMYCGMQILYGENYSYDASGNRTASILSLAGAPQIIGQPVAKMVAPGELVTFSVVVGDASGVTFQWKFNGIDIAGATGDSLILLNVGAANAGRYSVVVTNSLGSIISTATTLMLDSDGDGVPDVWYYNPVIPAPGLVAFWRGQADASDSVGAHHGTFYNGGTVTTPSVAPGLVGKALSFDGTVNVHIPYAADLEPAQITIEAWVYPTVESGSFQTIITRPRGGDGPSWALGLQNGSVTFRTYQGNTGGNSHIPLNQWTHVAATSDGTTKSIYINGVLSNQEGNGGLTYDQPGPVTLGDNFQGKIDELSIYNRVLTLNQVAAITAANNAGKDLTRPYFTSPSILPWGRVGFSYSQQFTTLFGTPPVTFSLLAGGLPPGLIFSSAGLLSGTPSVAGNFSFTLRVTDATANWNFIDQLFTVPVLQPIAPPAGLLAWWPAEGNAQDSAGTNHGTLSNGAGFAAGEVDQAFALNGVNQSVEIPDAPALRPASITLEAWVMFNTTDSNQAIFSKRISGGDASYYVFFSSNLLFAGVGNSSSTPSILTNFVPTVGRWYHLASTFDDTSKHLSLYVDGVQIVGGTVNVTIAYDTNPISWGRYDSRYLNGRIDEAAIYQRALSAAEIAYIYNAGPAGKRLLTEFEQWKLTYLGEFSAPDAGDPDGDGQSNLFEYVAGLIPTDPASRFQMRVETVASQPGQKNITFSPLVNGRTYSVDSSSSLVTPNWSTLPQSSQIDNGATRTVTDLNALPAPKFYRVQITKP